MSTHEVRIRQELLATLPTHLEPKFMMVLPSPFPNTILLQLFTLRLSPSLRYGFPCQLFSALMSMR